MKKRHLSIPKRIQLWSPNLFSFFRKDWHTDRPRKARLAQSAHIKHTPPDRISFRRYWREHAGHVALLGKPRRWRRATVLAWYRAGKHHEPQGIVSYATANA
jgi:hypothetical protein